MRDLVKKYSDTFRDNRLIAVLDISAIVITALILIHLLFGTITVKIFSKEIVLFRLRLLFILWIILMLVRKFESRKKELISLKGFFKKYLHEIILLSYILIITALHFMSIGYGLPHLYDVDENFVVPQVVRMVQEGSFNHQVFSYGSIYYYLMFIAFSLFYLFVHAQSVPFHFFYGINIGDFFYVARAVNTLIAAISLYLVYLLGKRMKSKNVGLAAALLLGLNLSHFLNSVTVRMDMLVMTLLLGAFLLILKVAEKGKYKHYVWSAVLIALATGTKFYGLFMFAVLIYAHFLKFGFKPNPAHKRLIISFFIIIGVFFTTNPFIIIDFPSFMGGMNHLLSQVVGAKTHWSSMDLPSGQRYVQLLFYHGIGTLAGAFALLAIAAFFIKPNKKDGLLLIFPFVYFFVLIGSRQVHHRFLMVMLPFLIVYTFGFLEDKIHKIVHTKKPSFSAPIFWLILIFCIILPTKKVFDVVAVYTKPTTADKAFSWIENNIPFNSRLLCQTYTVIPNRMKYKKSGFDSRARVNREAIIKPGTGSNYVVFRPLENMKYLGFNMWVHQNLREIVTFRPVKGQFSGPVIMISRVKPMFSYEMKKSNTLFFGGGESSHLINIGNEKEDSIYLDSGWERAKNDHRGVFRWISGNPSTFYFKLSPAIATNRSDLGVKVQYFSSEPYPDRKPALILTFNNEKIGEISLKPMRQMQSVSISLPRNLLLYGKKGINRLQFDLKYNTPSGLIRTADEGMLSPRIRIHEIKIDRATTK